MTPDGLSAAIVATLGRLVAEGRLRLRGDLPASVQVVRSRRGQGDLSSGVALRLAGRAGLSAPELAGLLAEGLREVPGVAAVEVGGPGFLDVRLPPPTSAVARDIVARGPSYGGGQAMAGERVVLRAPAVAPAPIEVVAGRVAAVADVTARIVEACGAAVVRVERPVAGADAGPVLVTGTGAPWPTAGPLGPVRTVDDLVSRVGADAARYALVRRPVHTPLGLDLDLWARAGAENPVYAVRLAHARLASVLRAADRLGPAIVGTRDDPGPTPFDGPARWLLRALADFPDVVLLAARRREPHRVTRHLEEVVTLLDHLDGELDRRLLPVGEVEPDPPRRLLAAATRVVLANGLTLLGVSAPDRM